LLPWLTWPNHKQKNRLQKNTEEHQNKLREVQSRLETERTTSTDLKKHVDKLSEEIRTAQHEISTLSEKLKQQEATSSTLVDSLKNTHNIDVKILEDELNKTKVELQEVVVASSSSQQRKVSSSHRESSFSSAVPSPARTPPPKNSSVQEGGPLSSEASNEMPLPSFSAGGASLMERDERRYKNEIAHLGKDRDEWRSRFLQMTVELEESKAAAAKSDDFQNKFEAALRAISKLQEDLEDEREATGMLREQLKAKFDNM